jgi:hypothetical protein
MVFLDINLTNDSGLLLMLLTVPSTCGFLKNTILFSGFQKPYKKTSETRNLESIHKKQFVENLTKTRV